MGSTSTSDPSSNEQDDIAQLRSLAHPLRLRMLSLLTGASLSAAEVARELEVTHANASYHLRLLADAGLIVIDGEERIRGGVAKRYRHPWDQPHQKVSGEELAGQVESMSQELLRRFARRQAGVRGTYTDAELWVDPEVWQQVVESLTQASLLLHAEARPPRTEDTMPVNLTVAAFGMQP
ncbi:MAG: helix-turn-helix domain-containing protein [Nocardioides sp.]